MPKCIYAKTNKNEKNNNKTIANSPKIYSWPRTQHKRNTIFNAIVSIFSFIFFIFRILQCVFSLFLFFFFLFFELNFLQLTQSDFFGSVFPKM